MPTALLVAHQPICLSSRQFVELFSSRLTDGGILQLASDRAAKVLSDFSGEHSRVVDDYSGRHPESVKIPRGISPY